MTLSCYTLITGLLLPTPGVRRTQGVICYLRRFSFPGAGCVKVCSFPSSSVASYRREHSSGLLFKAQFGVVSVLGFVCATGPIFCRAVLHKQHQRGVFLLWEQAVSGYVFLHSSRLPFKAQFGSVDILAGQEDVQAHFWILFNFNHVMPVLEVFVEAMAHIM